MAEYRAATDAFVAARPDSHTMMLTVVDGLTRRGPQAFGAGTPFFGWWREPDGTVAGALVCTPPYPLMLSTLPAAAVAALGAAFATDARVAGAGGFNARRADAQALAAACGRPTKVAEELRLYRLETLVPPDPAPSGAARPATPDDLPLVREWYDAFSRDTGQPAPVPDTAVLDRMSFGGLLLWEDGGVPVSMAGWSRPVQGTSRIAPVYTPPELRGRGYAAGATAAATVAAQRAGGTEVLLFTDLSNPTSNGIYLRIGYRPVEDRLYVLA
ncbi:GNAT family N-acetyltransferase [Streptomyces bambusae]|uniref:GNAT family N-acetyltransferase n=1 Tax=Streptomyces bambusae TaxID=1550616 RepID=UPI0027E0B7C7|nr:GNAT family N-acetyltransferase [Streptomyces bambusae]